MTTIAFTDACVMLGIDPKTLRHWLKEAQISFTAHPTDARLKCVTMEQIHQLATLHHRPLPLPPSSPLTPPQAPLEAVPSREASSPVLSVPPAWEPVDIRDSQRVTWWPDGFDPGTLPRPEYQEGDHVQFVRDETCAREGRVRRVLLTPRPGTHSAEGQRVWYQDADNILYIVTARGHDHRIRAAEILGRFVSSERVSRIVPLQD